MLVDQAGAGFADGAGPDQVRFKKGFYQLDDGVIHLRFSNGVDTVMRAPATFAIMNDSNIRLDHGDVWAIVPAGAEGFTWYRCWIYHLTATQGQGSLLMGCACLAVVLSAACYLIHYI